MFPSNSSSKLIGLEVQVSISLAPLSSLFVFFSAVQDIEDLVDLPAVKDKTESWVDKDD